MYGHGNARVLFIALPVIEHGAISVSGMRPAIFLLASVYGWFTEGFDTLDLKEAKALLDELYA